MGSSWGGPLCPLPLSWGSLSPQTRGPLLPRASALLPNEHVNSAASRIGAGAGLGEEAWWHEEGPGHPGNGLARSCLLYLPGSSDPDTPDAPTVEGKEVEEVEMSLEAMLPGAIA